MSQVRPVSDPAPGGNLRGAAFMAGSMAAFVSSDAILKSVSDSMTLPQALLVRGFWAVVFLAVMVWFQGGFRALPEPADRRVLVIRTLADLGAALSFLYALFRVDLAIVAAIAQATPLMLTLAGSLFLGMTIGWRRYLAIATGFFGVLLIIQPGGTGFQPDGLWVLVSVAFVVVRDLATRNLSDRVTATYAGLITAFPVMVAGGFGAFAADWPASFWPDTLTLAICAFVLVFGIIFAVESMRHGEVAVVAPFRYFAIPFALFLDWILLGKFPNALAMAGITIVIVTGAYTFHRERARAREGQKAP